MKDYIIGDIDKRQLHLRFFAPFAFQEWRDGTFRFKRTGLFNPRRWVKAIFDRYGWGFRCRRFTEGNHRCYCPVGGIIDGNVSLAGFSVLWWYSRYGGPVPCVCDQMMAELFPEEEL